MLGRIRKLLKPEEVIEQVDSRTIAASPLAFDLKSEEIESFLAQLVKVQECDELSAEYEKWDGLATILSSLEH